MKKELVNRIPELISEKGMLKGGFSALSARQLSRLKGGNSTNDICDNFSGCQGTNTDSCANERFCKGTNVGACSNGLNCSDFRDSIGAL